MEFYKLDLIFLIKINYLLVSSAWCIDVRECPVWLSVFGWHSCQFTEVNLSHMIQYISDKCQSTHFNFLLFLFLLIPVLIKNSSHLPEHFHLLNWTKNIFEKFNINSTTELEIILFQGLAQSFWITLIINFIRN